MRKLLMLPLLAVLTSGCWLLPSGFGEKAPADGGVYKSVDGGLSFEQKTKINEEKNLANESILSLRLDPQNSQVVYVGTPNAGILRSENSAELWVQNQGSFVQASEIYINPQNSQNIYAFVQVKNKGGRVLQTNDGGKQWQEIFIDKMGQAAISSFALDKKSPKIVYVGDTAGGIYKSTDSGQTWKSLLWAKSGIAKIEVDNVNNNKVYIATVSTGALRTDDGGENFLSLKKINKKVYNIIAHPYKEGALFVSDQKGVKKSEDSGETFTVLKTLVKPESLGTRGIAIDPKDENKIYLASRNIFYKSINGGETWKAVPLGINRIIKVIEIDPINPDIIYLGTYKDQEKSKFRLLPSVDK